MILIINIQSTLGGGRGFASRALNWMVKLLLKGKYIEHGYMRKKKDRCSSLNTASYINEVVLEIMRISLPLSLLSSSCLCMLLAK